MKTSVTRNYEEQGKIQQTYEQMISQQNLEYVKEMKRKYKTFPNIKKNFWDIVDQMESIYDDSDPDTINSQIYHAFQTGQSLNDMVQSDQIRKKPIKDVFNTEEWLALDPKIQQYYVINHQFGKLYEDILEWQWLPLVGFIHDLGKIMLTEQFGGLPQWSVVGDTFPVGYFITKINYIQLILRCKFTDVNLYFEKNYHSKNTDYEKYDQLGIYTENCGLEQLEMSWGHDEYLAHVLSIKNQTNLSREAVYLIRFHSFYSWHSPKNSFQRGYQYLASDYDWKMLPLLKLFQKSDLYSKLSELPNINQIKQQYQDLITTYLGNQHLVW